jgi:predicted nucleotidyltransferase
MDGKLTELVSRLKEAAGKNLESVTLYGSAARGDFRPGASDLNVLCTLVTIDMSELQLLAPVVAWWTGELKEPAPLFFLTEELRRSTDVFAIESLDIQRSHRVLYGSDPVADLEIPMNLHRVEVEHELRLMLLRLRQHVVHAGRNEMELTAVLKRSISGAVALLRHTLLAFGTEPPLEPNAIFAQVEEKTGASATAFATIYDYRSTGKIDGDSFAAYDEYMHALEKVIVALDGLVPKKEWQRVQQ